MHRVSKLVNQDVAEGSCASDDSPAGTTWDDEAMTRDWSTTARAGNTYVHGPAHHTCTHMHARAQARVCGLGRYDEGPPAELVGVDIGEPLGGTFDGTFDGTFRFSEDEASEADDELQGVMSLGDVGPIEECDDDAAAAPARAASPTAEGAASPMAEGAASPTAEAAASPRRRLYFNDLIPNENRKPAAVFLSALRTGARDGGSLRGGKTATETVAKAELVEKAKTVETAETVETERTVAIGRTAATVGTAGIAAEEGDELFIVSQLHALRERASQQPGTAELLRRIDETEDDARQYIGHTDWSCCVPLHSDKPACNTNVPRHSSDASASSASAAQLAVELRRLLPQLKFRKMPRWKQMIEILTFGFTRERGTDHDDRFALPSPDMSRASPYNLTHGSTHARARARARARTHARTQDVQEE